MEGVSFHRLVILLVFFHLIIFSNAVPSTRTWGMAQNNLQLEAFSDVPDQSTYDDGMMEEVLRGRMELESNDYPGSGANDRHTPKPPGRRLK